MKEEIQKQLKHYDILQSIRNKTLTMSSDDFKTN